MLTESPVANLYLATLAVLGVYGLHRTWLLRRFRRIRSDGEFGSTLCGATDERAAAGPGQVAPFVTVQLPLYNERTVAERLLRAVGELDYPRERFEVQVLDDSDDETCALVDREVARLVHEGVDASVVRRPDRGGFKAGALEYGLATAKGDLLCIFDADFLPRPSFLSELVPQFANPKVGMVQARWEHVNRDQSPLTRAQATLLDGHFVIEHSVRAASRLFFNFNGTAGVWRRQTIQDAGGWEHDTLTEDLDLSYRAQLAGWRFAYASGVGAPAEVPPGISAFKSQQHRWAKGSVQVARKLGGRILRAPVPWRVKLEAAAHLTGNTGYPLVLLLAVLLPLSVAEQTRFHAFWHIGIFLLCTLSVIAFYDASQRALGRRGRKRLFDVPAALSLGIGMCVSQTRAVLEGLFQKTGEFVRTPKEGNAPRGSSTEGKASSAPYRSVFRGLPGIELLFASWFALALVRAYDEGVWGSFPFLLLFFWGFSWVGFLSLREWLRTARRA